jgi:putative transposase
MKDSYPQIGLTRFCRLLGITRQAFYQHFWFVSDWSIQEQMIVQQVQKIRQLHPVIGGRKLYCMLQSFLLEHQIKMGRDALFNLLSANKLLVRKQKRKISTTQSHHWLKKYPNLIKQWQPYKPLQLWVADITYVAVQNGFLYLSLITDAYSHKIMGYNIANNLGAVNTFKALQMALANNPLTEQLIHHSDRGIQYCCADYINLLKQNNIQISMTESGDPLENALAERINGIIKQEYLQHYPILSVHNAQELIKDVVDRYNNQRPHLSINLLTPNLVHQLKLPVNRKWNKHTQMPNIVNQYQD